MNRLRVAVVASFLLYAATAFAARPPAVPGGTRLTGDRVTPTSFWFSSLPPGRPGNPGIVTERRPEGINPPAERVLERLKENPQGRTPAELGHFTFDRNNLTGGFALQPELGPLAPTVNNGFDGISQGAYIPSEPTVAAGPLNIFSAGNVNVTVTNKDGTNKVETTGSTFFGVPNAEGAISDAQCYYDALRGRFVALCFTQGTSPANYSNFYLAISKTNDARGAWWLYKFDMTKDGTTATSNWSDYQALGVSQDKIAMTAQQFTFAGNTYKYPKIRVLDREAAYSGATLTFVDFVNFAVPPGGTADDNFVTKAARNLTAGDNTVHLLCVRTVGGTNVTYRSLTGTPAAPTLSAGNRVTVASYSPPPDAVQKGSATLVATNDCRPTDFYVRNGVLICAWHTAVNLGGQVAALRLFRLRTSDLAVLTDETFGAAGVFMYYPAVTVDSVGTIFLGFDRSSSTEYPSAYATGKRRGDAALQPSALLKTGISSTAQSRWGDYTGIDNDATLSGPGGAVAWYAGQYTKATNTFGTWINKLTFSYGQINGTVADDCDGNAATTGDRTALAGVTLTLKQGASVLATTTSDGAGNYGFGYLESGTYDVVVTPPAGGGAVDATAGTGATTQTRVSALDLQVALTNTQTSAGNAFFVASPHGAPTTAGITPAAKNAGDPAFTLTVTGAGFIPCSVVRLDGADRVTTFGNAGQLTAAIPASDLLAASTHAITVFTPAPGGGSTSNAQTLTVSSAGDTQAPVATMTSPVGGESWAVGSAHAITWTATDNLGVSAVDLAFSSDGGATFPTAIATGLANSGTFAWTVPGVLTASARVRVIARDAAGNVGADSSHANFAITGWTVAASAGAHGTVTPAGSTAVADGATPSYTITPNATYHVQDVLVNGVSVGAVTNYTFTPVHANQTIAGSFAIDTFTLTASASGNGTVAKSPDQPAYDSGTSVTLTATPAAGWNFAGWTGDASGTTNPLPVTMDGNKNITATFIQHIYTWNQTGSASFTTPSNWTPARAAPATDDVLLFTGGGAVTATGVPAQTIARLALSNNSNVSLVAASTATLSLAGAANEDLDVPAGCTLQLIGGTGLTLAIGTGATGLVGGTLAVLNGPHRLTALDAGSLVFGPGAVVTLGSGFTGNFFGTGTGASGLNSVVFQGGSLLAQSAGANPFGASAPNSVVLFQGGSRFRLDGALTPSFSGRTYADFEYNVGGGTTVSGGTAFGMDSVIVTQGTFNLNLTGGGTIRGNLNVRPGATLGINPASGSPVFMLGGATAQVVNIAGTFVNTANATLNVNNPAGVTLLTNWTLAGPLTFTVGRVTTTLADTLIVPATGRVSGASAISGWVAGNLRRNFAAGASSRTFDVGDAAGYSPVTVALSGAASAFDLSASATTPDHPALASSDLDAAKTVNRYWTLAAAAAPAFTSYDATFAFPASDLDAAANSAALVVRRYAGTWSSPATGARTATSTQATGLTAFGDFALGETATFTITASAGANGTVTPSGAVGVPFGGSQGFTIAAAAGYTIANVLVDAVSVGAVPGYTFTNVTANHTLAASFADSTAPVVTVTSPNGGEALTVGASAALTWTATDGAGVTAVDLFLSRTGATGPFDTVAVAQPNTGSYNWTVTGPATSDAWLKVVARDAAGNAGTDLSDAAFAIGGTAGVEDGAVTAFALTPVRPNPMHAGGHFGFALPRAATVHMGLLDVQGREMLVLADGDFGAGRHSVAWTNGAGANLSAGLYFVRLRVAGRTFTQRFVLAR